MHHYLIKVGNDRGYIEGDQAFNDAVLHGDHEFDGYCSFSQGFRHLPFEVTPVHDLQAPADYVTLTGGRYNAVH